MQILKLQYPDNTVKQSKVKYLRNPLLSQGDQHNSELGNLENFKNAVVSFQQTAAQERGSNNQKSQSVLWDLPEKHGY